MSTGGTLLSGNNFWPRTQEWRVFNDCYFQAGETGSDAFIG